MRPCRDRACAFNIDPQVECQCIIPRFGQFSSIVSILLSTSCEFQGESSNPQSDNNIMLLQIVVSVFREYGSVRVQVNGSFEQGLLKDTRDYFKQADRCVNNKKYICHMPEQGELSTKSENLKNLSLSSVTACTLVD